MGRRVQPATGHCSKGMFLGLVVCYVDHWLLHTHGEVPFGIVYFRWHFYSTFTLNFACAIFLFLSIVIRPNVPSSGRASGLLEDCQLISLTGGGTIETHYQAGTSRYWYFNHRFFVSFNYVALHSPTAFSSAQLSLSSLSIFFKVRSFSGVISCLIFLSSSLRLLWSAKSGRGLSWFSQWIMLLVSCRSSSLALERTVVPDRQFLPLIHQSKSFISVSFNAHFSFSLSGDVISELFQECRWPFWFW